MIDTLKIFEELQKTLEPSAARTIANIFSTMYADLQNTVTKTEFNELKEVVHDLAEAQKRTESRVGELAERVEELAEAQMRTEARVEELAEAQKRTEDELHTLIKDHKETRKQLGGLTTAVGYTLENEAFKALPALLKKDYGLLLQERLKHRYVKDRKGEYIEINIIGSASQNGRTVTIVGESKSQLSKKGIDAFLRRKVNRLSGLYEHIFPLLITHMTTSPDVESYAKEKGIALYYSFDF
ncbi:chordopoxvirus fusion protein [candidate division KSB1 bacterium]|nr:chordopoxvirus fusion protein [candidate division KSB1 bacterium]NIR73287.1 chordopoxvirus fusion protein [candidate division KSB1 bacterium]NIS26993.1 chordopoxvirus fusion protein [candidate division KSB1 bacterium]NIT73833.1 chordopoxvirus fusion protein [candidate division KSB1 bacterium]NIU27738.1 chordopoxvirus fusion protein [candidate division KSB1 bacterium]